MKHKKSPFQTIWKNNPYFWNNCQGIYHKKKAQQGTASQKP